MRQNQLIGYGLVVGLNGTGDTLNNIPFTKQSLHAMLERLGVNIRGQTLRTGNVAAVMVTANLPPFGTQGTRIDVTVSALGDAKSLQGGMLLVTPLLGADGNVYAVGQGSVAIGGFQAEGEAAKIVRGVPTVGRIANGALIEREIDFTLNRLSQLRLALRNPDFTTAKRIAAAINDFIGAPTAEPLDPATVGITVPQQYRGNVVSLLTEIEQLQVEPDLAAKIVIDERSGIIVMGRDVRVSMVAVAQGNLTVTITETPQVSQPTPFSRGGTTTRGAAHPHRRAGGRQEARAGQGRRVAAAAGRRAQCARHRPARPDRHPAGDQGGRRDPGRHRGDVMATALPVAAPGLSALDLLNAERAGRRQAVRRQQGQGARGGAGFRGGVPQFHVPAHVHRHRRRRPVRRPGRDRRLALVPHRRIRQVVRQGRRHRHRRSGLSQPDGAAGNPAMSAPRGRHRPIASAGEAERAIANLNTIMDRLVETVEEETAHVRAGRLRDAAELDEAKVELARAAMPPKASA